jgi:hypothetical protein
MNRQHLLCHVPVRKFRGVTAARALLTAVYLSTERLQLIDESGEGPQLRRDRVCSLQTNSALSKALANEVHLIRVRSLIQAEIVTRKNSGLGRRVFDVTNNLRVVP